MLIGEEALNASRKEWWQSRVQRIRVTLFALHVRIATRMTVLGCGIIVFAIGATTVLGYSLGVDSFSRWRPDDVAMAPNTALGFIFTGFALTVLATSNRIWRCN